MLLTRHLLLSWSVNHKHELISEVFSKQRLIIANIKESRLTFFLPSEQQQGAQNKQKHLCFEFIHMLK